MTHLVGSESGGHAARLVRFASFEVDFEARELRKDGARVHLQHKPFRILEMLLKQPGSLVTRADLANDLWPHLSVSFERSLNTAMNTLRQALGDSPQNSQFIETRSGLGYRFIAPVEEIGQLKSTRENHQGGDAYQDCLKGRYFLNKVTSESPQRAIGCFRSALNQDELCAPAWAGLADAYSRLALSGTVEASNIAHEAREAAHAAVNCDVRLPAAHVALGSVRLVFDADRRGAASDFARAIELNADDADPHCGRALLLSASGKHAEALRAALRARTLEPLSLPVGLQLARILYLARDFDAAIKECWNLLSLEPRFAPAQTILGLANQQLGLHEEALTELENACICSDRHPAAVCAFACVSASVGERQQAEYALHELGPSLAPAYASSCWRAAIHAALGDPLAAIEELRTAAMQRDPLLLWAGVDPAFDTLRGQSAFTALTRRF